MCGRSSLTKTEADLEKRFNAFFYSEDLERYNPLPSYNIAPSHIVPIIKSGQQDHFEMAKWGLISNRNHHNKTPFMMINARKETIMEKPFFAHLLSSNR